MGSSPLEEIDDVVHGRMRLGILAYLKGAESVDFVTLRATLEASDGNLSTQLRLLEQAGYVELTKGFSGRRPQTTITITTSGIEALAAYKRALLKLLE